MSNNLLAFIVSAFVTFVFSQIGATFYEGISIFLFVYFFVLFYKSVGVSYNLIAIPILLLVAECLIGSVLVYRYYNDHPFIIAFQYYMFIDAETYFAYVVPATIAMIIGLVLPFRSKNAQTQSIKDAISRTKQYLEEKSNIGRFLIIIGASALILKIFSPYELEYVFYLLEKLIVIGAFYIYFSKDPYRTHFMLGAVFLLLLQSIFQGMFGDLVYILILGGLLILLNKQFSHFKKISFILLLTFFILSIQSIKTEYRRLTWYGGGGDRNQTEIFTTLLFDKMTAPEQIFTMEGFMPVVVRMNQGMIVSRVMGYIPEKKPFADGETILNSTFSTFVPRIFWPDKPIAGGKYNMQRFTGMEVEGYSMNVGVIGEAYGNFGKNGGVVFMFVYGVFFNLIFYFLIGLLKKNPTLILWVPFIFVNAVQAETDTLMTINSTIKNILFVGLLYWSFKRYLKIKL
ncbi:MAG: hypothetical protein ACOVP6_05925 [Lacibacter sp.]